MLVVSAAQDGELLVVRQYGVDKVATILHVPHPEAALFFKVMVLRKAGCPARHTTFLLAL